VTHPGGRPRLPPGERRASLTVKLPPVLLAELRAIAAHRGESVSAVVERALHAAYGDGE
jgi:Ribbon-helix-helix protein, copG family